MDNFKSSFTSCALFFYHLFLCISVISFTFSLKKDNHGPHLVELKKRVGGPLTIPRNPHSKITLP